MVTCIEKLKKRSKVIDEQGFQSKERVLLDEEIKVIFEDCEELL
jgi:hypothetical protein